MHSACGGAVCCQIRFVTGDALEKTPREQGLKNVERLLPWDLANCYQEKSWELNFLVQDERAPAKFVGRKYAYALYCGGLAISLGLKAMQRMLSPAAACSEICGHSNAPILSAVPSACMVAGLGSAAKLTGAADELVGDRVHVERGVGEALAFGGFERVALDLRQS